MKRGFTLIEMLIVILISVLIIGVIVGLFMVHQQVQAPTKMTSDIMEIQRAGMAQLEWIFSRWGTGTPCNDPTGANICTRIRACDRGDINGNFTYPPPSSLCVTIRDGNPCDEIWFYANLEGVAIATNVYRDRIQLVSCRLKTEENGDKYCFHIMRYGKFFRDSNNNDIVLIFGLEGLNNQNAECLDPAYLNPANYNAEASRIATIYNGYITNQQGILQNWLDLEGGDIIIMLPKLIHLYCETDGDITWLMMEITMPGHKGIPGVDPLPSNCTQDINVANQGAIRIAPVESFQVSIVSYNKPPITDTSFYNNPLNPESYLNESSGSIMVDITFRNFENKGSSKYKTYRVIRYFGR